MCSEYCLILPWFCLVMLIRYWMYDMVIITHKTCFRRHFEYLYRNVCLHMSVIYPKPFYVNVWHNELFFISLIPKQYSWPFWKLTFDINHQCILSESMTLWHYETYICLNIAGMHMFTNNSASCPDIYRVLRLYTKYTYNDIDKAREPFI